MTPGGQARIGNVDLVKQLNSAAVYRLIYQYGPIPRIQIALALIPISQPNEPTSTLVPRPRLKKKKKKK
ncbi:hypothetical protein, partial [Escherichia coli]|uniref:hypothetical protein n=1 Tax=Escherichia coli TaxID=562 RepID=UPI001BAFD81F